MSAAVLSCLIFALTLGGIALGALLRTTLPPAPFIAILAFWLIIIFASFSLFAALNVTVFAFLSLFALSASCAIFLILELSQPFTGLLIISSAPLRNALGVLGYE